MWIVFGWGKEERHVAEVANAYCYDCRQTHASIDGTPLHEGLVRRIENTQLGGKTPKQLKFIRESMDAEREYAQRMKEGADREA
jgi:hypothetical protein